MSIVNTLSLESNRKIKINFDGGDLSSDAGLLLIKEFVSKLGIDKLFGQSFKTNDSALFRYHTDKENLLQMIYMIIAGYFEDDTSDELTNDPVFKAVLNKGTLASQPTISRFHNRMDEDSLNQFLSINQILRKKVYSIQMPEAIILDLDSTLLNAYGKQEGRAFNFHYQSNGYHPLVCYDGITGDLIKISFVMELSIQVQELWTFFSLYLMNTLKVFRKLNFFFVVIAALQRPVYINSVKKTVPAM